MTYLNNLDLDYYYCEGEMKKRWGISLGKRGASNTSRQGDIG